MDALVILIPLLPLLAALWLTGTVLCGWPCNTPNNTLSADISKGALMLAAFLAIALAAASLLGKNTGSFSVGQWLGSDTLNIRINYQSNGLPVFLAALFAVLLAMAAQFTAGCFLPVAGKTPLHIGLCLFASAILQLVLSANAIGTLMGWQLTAFCALGLTVYNHRGLAASASGLTIFLVQRTGDAGFLLGAGLTYAWTENLNWAHLSSQLHTLSSGQVTSIGLCYLLAILAQSAQLPFSIWLPRTIDSTLPANAILAALMPHTGIYLLLLLQPVFEEALLPRILLGVVGFSTAVYGYFTGLAQTAARNALAYAIAAQLGIMCLEASLGFWQLAAWHLCAHVAVRFWQFLNLPALQAALDATGARPHTSRPPASRRLFVACLQGFWLDLFIGWTLIRPIRRLSHDLAFFDRHIVDQLTGNPQHRLYLNPVLAQPAGTLGNSGGLPGKLTNSAAAVLQWFDKQLALRGVGKSGIDYGRKLGFIANKIERLLLGPRYLALVVFITLLVAF